ncbi:MAG: chemotaxis protein CheB [Planctomycetota bacterium]
MSAANEQRTIPQSQQESDVHPPRYIVGIGASAGGLESLEQLFRYMPTSSGMAFVVIQHLSPDFKSMMNELLARDTTMRIVVVEDGVRVEANVIYLMPPKKEMLIADGCLHLSDKDSSRSLTMPIDHFLESLAREKGDASIAVILSGSGTDGTRGIEDISRRGGLVLSESLDTAKFDGMPSSAQATGKVDLVLSPSDIGHALVSYCEDPSSLPRGKLERRTQDASLKGIDAIFQLFRNVYDIDFSSYKDSTVMRRIRRRLAMAHVDTFDQYSEVLQNKPEELHALYSDLLIGVTQFFRDPEIFGFLDSDVLADVLKQRNANEAIRVWVAGCATGEEAYSVAIAFQEAMRVSGDSRSLKVFATDVHKRSIEYASRGVFGEEVLKEIGGDLLERYFTERSDGFQIRPEIRQMVVFAPHNVLRDAPFTDLDFVSCRNMLIYLRPAAQRRAISLFHYGLRVGGVLLLGGSESTGELASEFDVISDRHRIYRKNRDVRLTQNLRSPLTSADSVHRGLLSNTTVHRPPLGAGRTRQLHDELLDRFMPPSILVDASRSVIDTFAGAEKLLHLPSRQPSLDVLDLVDREIRTTLSGAIARAMKSESTVRFGKLDLGTGEETESFDLTVDPLSGKADEACYLISFDPVTAEVKPPPDDEADVEQQRATLLDATSESELERSRNQIRQLEDDLRYSRENLQAMIEELETSNEELQATNEELIASNEELQSTNEELHSLNEELYSVNSEHQRKIVELAELNRDMNHLLENTDVATVFLDSELRIRRFTSRVREVFELIDEDIGRSIHVFGSKLRIEDLLDRLRGVLETGNAYEREVQAGDGTSYLMRLLPYRPDDRVSGVVMMWINVSSLEVMRGRLRWLSAIVESTNDAIIGQDLRGTITSWNRGAENLYGFSANEIIGKHMNVLIPEERRHEVTEYRERIMRSETVLSVDTVRLRRDGSPIDVSLTVSPVFNSDQKVIGISKIARDIGERIEMEKEIRSQIQQRERFLAMLSHELRNPLNAVSSASAILSDERASSPDRVAAAATIGRQVAMVNHLLVDLLDVARIAEDRINLKFEILDLRELVPTIEEVVQSELDRHGCAVDFDLADHPVVVNGDRTRLIQVQVNLIHNAAKYSETVNPVRVRIKDGGEAIHVSVADDGRGIPPEKLESIFEPFAQLDQSRKQSDGGLGVGLTLAKSLIELHGGKIVAESDGEGLGSVFHIWLPKVENLEAGRRSSTESTTGASESSEHRVTRPLKICIVEDMEDSRTMIATLLQLEGHEVMTAANGATAIELLTSQPFDFALVDIGLPDINGYDVARRVRERVPSRSLTLIALTGYGQPSDIQEAVAAGFDDHIVKPIDPERLHHLCVRTGAISD